MNSPLPPHTTTFTEGPLVQQTTADYLERQLGWESVYAYNSEDFGPDSLLGRGSEREVVLRRSLRQKLTELNPGLPAAAYDSAVRQLTATVAGQSLFSANRDNYDLVREGVAVTFRDQGGEQVQDRLRVFDFETPENNHFLCVREMTNNYVCAPAIFVYPYRISIELKRVNRGYSMATAHTKVFMSNKSQAVRLPKAVELPESVREVDIVAIGSKRVITPAGESWDEWFDGPGVSVDFMSVREQPADARREKL